MDILIISFCLVFLLLSNICMLVVVTRITDKVNLHHRLISEILDNLCDALSKEENEEENDDDEC